MGEGSFKNIFKNRNFLILWVGHVISFFGDMLTFFALPLLVYNATGSKKALAMAALIRGIPILVLGLFAGALVDRWNRKKIMISSDLIRAVLTLPLIFVGDKYFVITVYIVSLLKSVVGIFFNPAYSSTIPFIAEKKDLNTVNSLSGLANNLLMILSPLIGVALLVRFNYSRMILFIDIVSFIISAIAVYFVNIPEREKSENNKLNVRTVLLDAKDGVKYIVNSKPLLAIMITSVITMFGQGFIGPLWTPYVVEVLGKPATFQAKLVSNQGIGMLAGTVMVMLLGLRGSKSNKKVYTVFAAFTGAAVYLQLVFSENAAEMSFFKYVTEIFRAPSAFLSSLPFKTGIVFLICIIAVIVFGLKASETYKKMYSYFVLMTGITIFMQITTANFNVFVMWGILVGIFISGMNVSTQTIMQHATRKDYMGRISSAFFLINQGFSMLSMSLVAIVGDIITTKNLLVFACSIWLVGCIIGSIAMLLVKEKQLTVIETTTHHAQ